MATLIKSVIHEKCPECGNGEVFQSKGNAFLFKTPVMNTACVQCGYKFEKEPGYFIGAMYVSYGLGVAEMAIVLVLSLLIKIQLEYVIYLLVGLVVLMSTFNYRKARIIWMYLI